jgi:hypothetical protein
VCQELANSAAGIGRRFLERAWRYRVGPLVQAEVLSPEVTPVAEGLYQMVRQIEEQAAAQTTHPVSIETRIHNILVATRIRLNEGLLDDEYRDTLDEAKRLISDLESAPTADSTQLPRERALVDAYEAAWEPWVKKTAPDMKRLARIKLWVRDDGRADYCLIRWPEERRTLLSQAAAAAQPQILNYTSRPSSR